MYDLSGDSQKSVGYKKIAAASKSTDIQFTDDYCSKVKKEIEALGLIETKGTQTLIKKGRNESMGIFTKGDNWFARKAKAMKDKETEQCVKCGEMYRPYDGHCEICVSCKYKHEKGKLVDEWHWHRKTGPYKPNPNLVRGYVGDDRLDGK